jgi:2-polyprenyl-3-methyl-5-hydroxy-6-metoxy-1,4-benzoquinol methylase
MVKINLNKRDKERILKAAKMANKKQRKIPYQTIGTVKGTRNTDLRCKFMGLPNSFKGKSVLDIGCNLGAMCYVAKDRGADRVVGIDKSSVLLDTSSDIFSKHKYDISLINYDLNERGFEPLLEILGKEKFDYVFALSIYHHVSNRDVLWKIINHYCNDVCWFEGHKRNSKEEIQNALTSNLKAKCIDFIGNIKDHVKRPVFKCVFKGV